MQALKESVTNLNAEQIEHFKIEQQRMIEEEYKQRMFNGAASASNRLSKGEKKRAKRARRSEYGNPCTLR